MRSSFLRSSNTSKKVSLKKFKEEFLLLKNVTFGDFGGGGFYPGKRDLVVIPQDLPTLLQTSPGTNGMPKNLLRPDLTLPNSVQWRVVLACTLRNIFHKSVSLYTITTIIEHYKYL